MVVVLLIGQLNINLSSADESRHDKTIKMSVRPAKTDQPGHLIRIFAVRSMGS